MPLPFIGKSRERVLRELRDDWLVSNVPVALLEGFSGCGKSVLAGDLVDGSKIPTARVDAPADDHDLQDLFLDLAIALEAVGIDTLTNETQKGAHANFAGALREVVRRNRVLVIVDEAEHTFVHDAARPAGKLAGVVQQLGNSRATGKLLLISNRLAEHAVWSENCFRVRLPPLEEDEAVELLSQLLEHQRRSDKVEPQLRPALVRCFGCNPRAIHTLVTSLEFETLDHLITSIPGIWDLRDIEVSPDLVVQLERDLLGRILPKLEDEKDTAKFLRWLSVHRQPFRKEALEEFKGAGFASAQLLRSLVERMLLEYRHGWHTLNTIAREVSVQRLKEATGDWTQAHSLAANYHARHFRAQRIVHAERLAGSFAELRYHLYQAGRLEELEGLSERYTKFIRHSINVTRVPSDPAKLDERIALLTVLLATQGAKGLEFHLAKCFLKRNSPGDREAALDHIRRATGSQAPCETWLIRIELEWEYAGFIAAQVTWRDALRSIPLSGNTAAIYLKAVEMLARDGALKDAVKLLKEGIEGVPPEFGKASLYQQCGELLARDGKLEEAVKLLKEGIEEIPPEFSKFSLYQECGELLARDGKSEEAIKLLKEGIEEIPAQFNKFSLYQECGELLARDGKLEEATKLVKEGIKEIPPEFGRLRLLQNAMRIAAQANRKDVVQELISVAGSDPHGESFLSAHCYGECLDRWMDEDWAGLLTVADEGLRVRASVPFRGMRAEAHIGLGELEEAWLDLESYEKRASPLIWLKAWIALRTNRQDDADRLALQYSGSAIEVQLPITEATLTQLWATARGGLNVPRTTFFRSLRRWLEPAKGEETSAALRDDIRTGEHDTRNCCFLVVTTEWDSKNGGLSTFNRMLCRALAKAKQTVICYVPAASEDELQRAAADGVRLIPAHSEAGVPPMATLLNPPEEIKNLKPDFIIGHDRQTGGYAKVLQKRDFPQSKRTHFIHTAPEEIEPSKISRSGTAAKRGEDRVKEQKDQAKEAILIVGVGPRLAREFGNHVHGAGFAPVHQLNPGFDIDGDSADANESAKVPPGVVCLVLGRAEDYELKGLDLAAQSMGAVATSWRPFVLPKLVVRGAPQGTGDDLSRKLRADVKAQTARPLPVVVREYADDLTAIQDDLRGASLLLMPSCVEGFGLVAAEAICAGVPVLISEQSGIAEILPDDSRSCILATRPDALTPLDPEMTKSWAEAISRILDRREAAFAAARDLKHKMAVKYTWEEAIRHFLTALGIPTS